MHYYQIASTPLEEPFNQQISPNRQGAWGTTRLALSSIRRDHQDRLLLGTANSHKNKNFIYHKWANTVIKHYFPDLKPRWKYQWGDKFGFTKDHILRIFELNQDIVAVTAYNGRGITTGPYLAKYWQTTY